MARLRDLIRHYIARELELQADALIVMATIPRDSLAYARRRLVVAVSAFKVAVARALVSLEDAAP